MHVVSTNQIANILHFNDIVRYMSFFFVQSTSKIFLLFVEVTWFVCLNWFSCFILHSSFKFIFWVTSLKVFVISVKLFFWRCFSERGFQDSNSQIMKICSREKTVVKKTALFCKHWYRFVIKRSAQVELFKVLKQVLSFPVLAALWLWRRSMIKSSSESSALKLPTDKNQSHAELKVSRQSLTWKK